MIELDCFQGRVSSDRVDDRPHVETVVLESQRCQPQHHTVTSNAEADAPLRQPNREHQRSAPKLSPERPVLPKSGGENCNT